MTIAERNNKLKHFITCLKCEVSGKTCDVNCSTQYDAGNMGEIIENLEAISKVLEQEPILDRDCEHCSKTYGTLGCCTTVSNKWVYSCKEGQREYLLDKIRAEIETKYGHCDICEYFEGFYYSIFAFI